MSETPTLEFVNARVPPGPADGAWKQREAEAESIAFDRSERKVIVVGGGLAGLAATASLAEHGYSVALFFPQPSPLHSPAAVRHTQLISAHGADFRRDAIDTFANMLTEQSGGFARRASAYRLSELSAGCVQLCERLGVKMSVSRHAQHVEHRAPTATGRRLTDALAMRMFQHAAAERVELFPRHEPIDFFDLDGVCRGIVSRDLKTGVSERHWADAIVLTSNGFGGLFDPANPDRESMGANLWRAYRRGARLANPSLTQPPDAGRPETLGGLWVDYDCMTSLPGLFAPGAANGVCFGAHRPDGAGTLAEIAEGWFVAPVAVDRFLRASAPIDEDELEAHPRARIVLSETAEELDDMKCMRGTKPAREFHAELAAILGEVKSAQPNADLFAPALARIAALRQAIKLNEMALTGTQGDMNLAFDHAYSTILAMRLGEAFVHDARERSGGGIGKAISVWEFQGVNAAPKLTKEPCG